ncbi:MAG TPA: oxidoreductase [Planctomycetaceae bacterium]|nr:oxidoreductase [Planctomycetaceae bacterium]
MTHHDRYPLRAPIRLSRRTFLVTATAVAGSGTARSRVGAASPNGRLRTAHIGVGGMGGADLASIASHPQVEVAALCDVDQGTLEKAAARHPHARSFRDFREMLATLGDTIDAVVVSTPDHTHAPAAMSALHLGKAVYCQKPLTHEVHEARQLRQVAEARSLVTQMGIQVHSSAIYRRAARMIRDGVIGKVSHVHAWSSKNWGYDGAAPTNDQAPPASLDWNLWLGTAATRPYAPGLYHPGNWRRLVDFGTGTLGDMGVHIFDTPFDALELTAPRWVRTTCRPPTGVGHPERNMVEYEFPGTAHTTESLRWTWYDGADAPPKSADVKLPEDVKLPDQGALFIGEGGAMLLPHIGEAVLLPQKKFADYRRPDVPDVNHYHQWVDACLGKGRTSADFAYAGPLTEALLLGVVANRFPGRTLSWNAETLAVVDLPEADALIRRRYRDGFEVPGLS